MTENEWQSGNHFQPLLQFATPWLTERKRRLFVVACYRQLAPYLPAKPCLQALAVVERFADGLSTWKDVEAATVLAWPTGCEALRIRLVHLAREPAGTLLYTLGYTITQRGKQVASGFRKGDADGPARDVLHCQLLRHIVHPFSAQGEMATAPDRELRSLAEGVYAGVPGAEDGLFDALSERGATGLASHFQRPTVASERQRWLPGMAPPVRPSSSPELPHLKGCWIVDRLRGAA
jgi:hypothetical protein